MKKLSCISRSKKHEALIIRMLNASAVKLVMNSSIKPDVDLDWLIAEPKYGVTVNGIHHELSLDELSRLNVIIPGVEALLKYPPRFKMKVVNKQHFEAILKCLHAVGHSWVNNYPVVYASAKYLYIKSNGIEVGYKDTNLGDMTEIDFSWLLEKEIPELTMAEAIKKVGYEFKLVK